MPDSAAVRTARSRAHKAGNHKLCLAGRCPDALTVVPDDDEAAHELEEVAEGYMCGENREAELRGTILIAAARACDANPSPGMIRALADALQHFKWAAGRSS